MLYQTTACLALAGFALVFAGDSIAQKRLSVNSAAATNIRAMARDAAGNIIAVGESGNSTQVAPLGLYGRHIFLAKLNADGVVLFTKVIQGNGLDTATGVALDPAGRIYICGFTGSTNFPTAAAAQGAQAGLTDAFLMKLSPDGSQTVFSTYWGGLGDDRALAVAVDSSGNATIVGTTNSHNFRTLNPIVAMHPGREGFVARFSSAGTLLLSSYLGSSGDDDLNSVAVDGSGTLYIGGTMGWSDTPRAGGLAPAPRAYPAGWVAKFDPASASFAYASFLAAKVEASSVQAIAVDAAGSLYATGKSGPYLFVDKLNPAGSVESFARVLAGDDRRDTVRAIALGPPFENAQPTIYLTGSTASPLFPIQNGAQVTGGGVFFIAENGGASFSAQNRGFWGDVWSIAVTGTRTWVGAGFLQLVNGQWMGGSWNAEGRLVALDPDKSDLTVYLADRIPVRSSYPDLSGPLPVWKNKELVAGLEGIPAADRVATALYTDSAGVYLATAKAGVFRLEPGVDRWNKTQTGLPADVVVNAFAGPPGQAGVVYAATSKGVFRTANRGETWQKASVGLPSVAVASIAVDPLTPKTVWAGTEAGGGLYRSTDGGETWTSRLSLSAGVIRALAPHPVNSGELIFGLGYDCDSPEPTSPGGLYRTADGGATWTILSLRRISVNAIAYDPANPRRIFAGACGGNDQFILALRPSGELKWSTYAGSALGDDQGWSIVAGTHPNGETTVVAAGTGAISVSGPIGSSLSRQDLPTSAAFYQIREPKLPPLDVVAATYPPGLESGYAQDLAAFHVTARNSSEQPVSSTSVYASVRGRLSEFTGSPDCGLFGGIATASRPRVGRCNLGDLPPGSEQTLIVSAEPERFFPADSIELSAWAVFGRGGELFAVAAPPVVRKEVTTPSPAVELSIAGPAEILAGAEAAFTFTARNPGTAARVLNEWFDRPPSFLTGPTCQARDTLLLPGQTRQFECRFKAPLTAPQPDGTAVNLSGFHVAQGLVYRGQNYQSPPFPVTVVQPTGAPLFRTSRVGGAMTTAFREGADNHRPVDFVALNALSGIEPGTIIAFVAGAWPQENRIRQLICRDGMCGIRADLDLPDGFRPSRLVLRQLRAEDQAVLIAVGFDALATWPVDSSGAPGQMTLLPIGPAITSVALFPDASTLALVRNNRILVVKVNSDATLELLPGEYDAPVFGDQILTADFNADGLTDVFTWSFSEGSATLRLGQPGSVFGGPISVPLPGSPFVLRSFDGNGDGFPDLLLVTYQAHVAFWLNNGAAHFVESWSSKANLASIIEASELADMNGDRALDLTLIDESGSAEILLGQVEGPMKSGGRWLAPKDARSIRLADIDLDRIPDAVFLGPTGLQVWLTQPPPKP